MSMEITECKRNSELLRGSNQGGFQRKNVLWGFYPAATASDRRGRLPYSYLAEDGIIDYNGVIFVCDEDKNRICLGDVSDRDQCINVPLADGGSLVVNRDCVGSLMKAIGMFSPEDKVRIMKAVSLDNKIQQMKMEIDEDTNSIGNGTTNTADGGREASATITDMDEEPS